ncbi:pyridoxine 5'-phosphate synthase [bacterium endosymbiont of Bathymodiolus sp. 5 South]|jgi:pyridoxine 5-phosphate synthase|uniref:pyridoxine 5'-phosphate synthase n=1 Tax=bacterium endosymbiont of Bathymodiolus sp. 5 South TaxID=1181670 RepID=UPI0010B9B790|nr:pyridoxine 5'-phosphate synthase [bacterium endosymbiont of Bathymodiolus sp. 5 South]CAC9434488.1 Pyridoxine 5'-phosphate synthase (EC 2.6.99.2) [uncultured Gammaproteobacteria bacterium]SHN89536.1 Pyridoxine 5'-phosphate synthase [bacterium endosymbiont of Bathymodiolus sp. 5 South]VVH59499.1 Pyridoxine 5'-phosphate synthase (EC [uncultured Gammaproteobacteria bacterium]VVH61437.1 Pyridoxine 5'-phosphate synthase (EC [uncultured Gammaproteobacteria bacterium]VVH64222.1 Pyridoxine 5'-phosp
MSIYLGVNIDHIATIRQARGTNYPSPVAGALLCEKSGADSITLHLREDRRHIQDEDVVVLREKLTTKMNLEMASTDEMIAIAGRIKPQDCCLVPEKREELTTEGGLDVVSQISRMTDVCAQLKASDVVVSLFIDAQKDQIDAAKQCGAPVIELHTGHYADTTGAEQQAEFERIKNMATYAHSIGLQVNAGHGLTLENTRAIAQLPEIVELNIGHSIIARAVFVGLESATNEMKNLMLEARV